MSIRIEIGLYVGVEPDDALTLVIGLDLVTCNTIMMTHINIFIKPTGQYKTYKS